MFSNLFKNLISTKSIPKSSIKLPSNSLKNAQNYSFSTSQKESPLNSFLFGAHKKLSWSEEMAELDKQFDSRHMKDHVKSILLVLLVLSVFSSVVKPPAAPQWNEEDEGRNEYGMGYEDEESHQNEHDE